MHSWGFLAHNPGCQFTALQGPTPLKAGKEGRPGQGAGEARVGQAGGQSRGGAQVCGGPEVQQEVVERRRVAPRAPRVNERFLPPRPHGFLARGKLGRTAPPVFSSQ